MNLTGNLHRKESETKTIRKSLVWMVLALSITMFTVPATVSTQCSSDTSIILNDNAGNVVRT